jgi:hypothetical protein
LTGCDTIFCPARCHTQLKALQEEIRREEEALGELHRASTRQRAEQEEAAKVDFYQRKAAAREKLRLQVRATFGAEQASCGRIRKPLW